MTLSFSTDNTGAFCSSGGWIDLTPYIERDTSRSSDFPQAVQDYTEYQGDRCAMPLLADDYGLYYNQDMFDAAGIKSPPKTISELDADAKKLTQRSSDGTIDVAGYVPTSGFYESAPAHYAPQWDAQWQNADGKSSLATDPGWTDYLEWDKKPDRLVRLRRADQVPVRRRRRVLGLERIRDRQGGDDARRRVPDGVHRRRAPGAQLRHGPIPGCRRQEDRYGAGYVTGSIIGIPRDSENQAAAWELVKYLTTDTDALVTLANQLANVPTTPAAAKSPKLDLGPQFDPFIQIFKSPNTQTNPITRLGQRANQELFQSFVSKYEAGQVDDLQAGLQDVDAQIDARRRTPPAAARRGAVIAAAADERDGRRRRRPAAPGPEPGSPAVAAEGDLAPPPPRAAADEPVAPRGHDLLRLSPDHHGAAVVHPLRPALVPALGGPGELRVPVQHGQADLARGARTRSG